MRGKNGIRLLQAQGPTPNQATSGKTKQKPTQPGQPGPHTE